MRSEFILVLASALVAVSAQAQDKHYPHAKVSFEDFKGLVAEVEPHRAKRLIDFDTFLKMSKEPGVVVFDSRSDFRFERMHLKGAKHLSFTDFTQQNLAKLIPDPKTKILIYCNNNFEGNQIDFASKVAFPVGPLESLRGGTKGSSGAANNLDSQVRNQAKPLMMALNIPTYVNLYGYGYRNVYELDELVNVRDARAEFEGSMVGASPSSVAR